MSRIPESFIRDLLARTDIVEVIGARVELKRAGKEYKARSPFTNEKTPSFFVNPAKQMYFDFSSGKNGNAISFLMDYERLEFVEAVEELARRAGLEVPRDAGQGSAAPVLEGPLDALAAAQRFFRAQLKNHPPAIEYLKKRAVDGDTARCFGIGYAPERWDALAKTFPDPQHALTAGLLVRKDGGGVYDRFRHRLMFPIRDARGRVIAFGGRTLGDDPAKYLNSPETPLFHKGRNLYGLYEARQAISAPKYLLVVEGYMDVVGLARHGIVEVCATLGTATTADHLRLLFRTAPRIVFCFDGDDAGRRAAWRALEQALPELREGRECAFMFLPEGHDPDTLVAEIGAEEFRHRVDQAVALSEFLLRELEAGVNLGSLDGRARLVALAKPHVQRLPEGPLRTLVLDELARRTGMTRADLEMHLAGAVRTSPPMTSATRPVREPGARRPVRRALQLLLEQPVMASDVKEVEQLRGAEAPGIEALIEAIEFFKEHSAMRAGGLIEHWRGRPEGEALSRLAGLEVHLSEGDVKREFHEIVERLRARAEYARAQGLLAQAGERPLTAAETAELRDLTRRRALASGDDQT